MSADADGGDHIFFSTKDPIRLVYSCVDTFVLIFGVSLNSLLIYLIRTKTVAAMEVYKKLLLMSCTMDLLVSMWTFITQPMPCVDHGYRTVIMNGLFRNASQEIRYAVYLVWIQLMLFFLITTMSQYVYRYCILCRNGEMPPRIFWALAFTQVSLNVFHACVLAWADYPRPEDAAKMVELRTKIHDEAGLTDINFISFVNAQSLPWWTHNIIMLIIIPSFYYVIIKCSMQIRSAVNGMNVLKLREYNNQVSAALFFQALLPTFEMAAWCIQMFVPLFMLEKSSVWVVIFSDIPIHLVPVLNAVGTIALVAPYRRAVCNYLGISAATSSIIYLNSHSRSRFMISFRRNKIGGSVEANQRQASIAFDLPINTVAE